jgi:hypothetical protein
LRGREGGRLRKKGHQDVLGGIRGSHLKLAVSETAKLNLVLPDRRVERITVELVVKNNAIVVLRHRHPGSARRGGEKGQPICLVGASSDDAKEGETYTRRAAQERMPILVRLKQVHFVLLNVDFPPGVKCQGVRLSRYCSATGKEKISIISRGERRQGKRSGTYG